MQNFSFKRLTAWIVTLMMLFTIIPINVSASAKDDLLSDITLYSQGKGNKKSSAEANSDTSATKGNNIKSTVTYGTDITALYDIAPQADETIYVLASSDFQASSHDAGATIVSGLLGKIKVDYPTMNGFLFAGDYDVSYNDSANGKAKLQETVQAVYGTGMDEIYVQGNHDNDNLVGSTLTASGANDAENYGVFVINEKDYMWYNNDEATIKRTADNLETYLNAKRNAAYTKPIFVISHLPLHYCMRTREGGEDGKHANYIFDVLNEAGNAGLNIIFMFGHNHSHGWDDYLGGAAIFLTKGDKINIAQNSTTVFQEETLAFTYMNAGYVGYYGTTYTSDVDKTLTMSVFEITGDTVTVKRYDSQGLHNLKSTGVYNVEHPDSAYYSTDTTVYHSPQTITLSKTITPAGGESGGEGGNTGSGTATSIEQVYTLEAGNYYIIVNDRNNMVLTGTATTDKDGHDALLLSGTASVDTTDLWYYDGTNFIYGGPEDTDKYLLMGTNSAYLGGTHSYRMADAYLNNDGTTFSIGRSQADDKVYLNQYGGANYTAASPYTSDGNSDAGSKWRIYKTNRPEKEPASFSANGVTVTAPGITGLNVTVETRTVDGYSAYKDYDINPENYTQGDEATVDIELDMTVFSANRPVMIIDNGDVIATVNITDGKVSFKTNHFSVYAAAQASVTTSGGNWVMITEPTSGTTYTYELTDTIVSGKSYLIGSGNNGSVNILNSNGGTISGTTTNGVFTTTSSVTDAHKWTFTGSGTSYTIQNVSTRGYLYPTASIRQFNKFNKWTYSLKTNGDNTSVTVDNNSGALKISRYISYISSGSVTTNSYMTNSFGADNTGSAVYLYEIVEHTSVTPGKYAKIDGTLAYEVKIGTSEEDALAKVMDGITGYTNTTASDPGNVLDDNALTWTLDPSYDSSVPGEYAVTIAYKGKTLGVAKVTVLTAVIENATISPNKGSVERGSKPNVSTGATITLTYDNDTTTQVDVTVGMLTGNFDIKKNGTYTGLTVTYGDRTFDNFTLEVTNVSGNNRPEYPDQGAVKVDKTATGIDFQSSGIAQVEISASGVPVEKGADVIVMLDLSSSMNNTVDDQTRLDVLKDSLRSMLTQLQANGTDGKPMDIRIAVADFHRYYTDSSSPYYLNNDDHLAGGSIRDGNSGTNRVYTGSGKLDADAFVDVQKLAKNAFDRIETGSGTNYDYAFDAIYQLGEAITTQNANAGEERDLFVIFMSDGTPFQFNYFSSQSEGRGAAYWNNWLQGTMTDAMFAAGSNKSYYNENGKHWMAEAIKGDPTSTYPVIRKNNAADTDGDTWVNVNGLGAKMYSIGFCLAQDKEITVDSMDTVIRNIASSKEYYFRANSADDLKNTFSQIGSAIIYAATNARFVDQMGPAFNLQMKPSTYTMADKTNKTLNPAIEIISYDIYQASEVGTTVNGVLVTKDMVGNRKGTYTVLETVTFNDDGTEAYSDKIPGNILGADGIIRAKYFFYNTSNNGVVVEGVNIPTDTNSDGTTTGFTNLLPSETFYWIMGTVQTSELAMRYYVYLEGSMEGNRNAGSYATNEFATLYYDNYLGNPCYKDTVSPSVAWKAANVSYAFYLVNDRGEIIVNQTTGETGSFANKIAVTNPVIYGEILLNNQDQIRALDVKANSGDVLPKYYTLYDNSAVYYVSIMSNGTGCWEIEQNSNLVASTYVTNFGTRAQYSNATKNETVGDDYTHTVVWFAVVWSVQAHPDTVVIDYGLPVDISVLTNDMFGENGKLAGVGAYSDKLNLDGHDTTLATGFGTSYKGTYGVATANTEAGTVRYTLNTTNGMKMSTYEKFAYAVNYTGTSNPGYYYDTITVIPATSIYYEESFVTTTNAKVLDENGNIVKDANGNDTYVTSGVGAWEIATDSTLGYTYDEEKNCYVDSNGNIVTQDEDRPGEYSLPNIDHNNIYGYDGINSSATTYSLGSAAKVTVDSNHDTIQKAPYAEFTFTGTGFDLISLTDNTSGTIAMRVWDANENVVVTKYVDNYYGYTYENGIWTVDTSSKDCIWQVPVLKISDLGYGTYTVRVYVEYEKYFDHTGDSSYTFVLDSIRVYDPAGDGINSNDTTIHDAYVADGEAYPHYLMVKEAILGVDELENLSPDIKGTLKGAVFIDGMESTSNAADYSNPGPNNEAYLAPGQSISFKLNANTKPIDVQLGAKLAYGDSVDVQLSYNGSAVKTWTLKTATDMYYTIMQYLSFSDINASWTTGTITIANVSSKNSNSIVSLTNIKATFDSDTITVIGSDGYTPSANDETESVSKLSLRTASFATALAVDESTGTETTEEVQIAFLVDAETIDTACAVMTALYAPAPEVFVPEVLEYTVTPGFFRYDTVNVITSKDVASLTVNSMEATKLNDFVLFGSMFKLIAYFEDILGIDFSSNDYYIWTVSIKRADSYEIIAYNEDGLSSDPSVPDSASSITKDDITGFFDRSKVIGIMKELADRIFSPEHFETYINERLDGKREIITQTSEDVEYIVIDGKIVNRYITETVVDLGNDGAETVKRVWITEADDTSTDEEASVSVYNKNGVGSNARKPDHKKEESENHGDEKDIPQT